MPISSLIVRTAEDRTEAISAELATHPAIEVSHVTTGSIAIVTETPDDDVDKHLWKQIEAIHGVNFVELIYHNFEDLEGAEHENKQT
ncbi:MAG: chaperone NapD [Candidatus Hydrogenedentes bacterium]|nr:chaperone NapD [Candidatus Hydrogenedentota bacterium]